MSATDERLVKLTELARKVWPDWPSHTIDVTDPSAVKVPTCGYVFVVDGYYRSPVLSVHHPRALDALEAALCVLAGELLTHDALLQDRNEWFEAAVELAARWISKAQCVRDPDTADEIVRCADELLAAAKGKP